LGRLHFLHVGHSEKEIGIALELFSEWKYNAFRIQAGSGYLVQEWLELVEVVAVEQDDLYGLAAQLFGECHAGEAAPDHDDARVVGRGHEELAGLMVGSGRFAIVGVWHRGANKVLTGFD